MKYQGKQTGIKLLWQVLSVIAALCGMLIIVYSVGLFVYIVNNGDNYQSLILFIDFFIQSIIFTICIFNLRSIVSTIIDRDPFNRDNIMRFKRIAFYILIAGLVNFAGNLIKGDPKHGLRLLHFGNFFITPTTVVLIIMASFAAVMGEIFRMAIEIKNENDLTI